ncbi:unnamed protein product [Nippostrongylus brasiliensis]|uniref:Alkylated DNA repair protein alkB homolog 8 (inferred by orthology to a human protein) n=1 Tax=Nippostrongylus brasiliensis TaxID=27835 RepID=A0A158QX18_NIPBR|nr:unnamed protein product [Nippostrongylus brasiliensis]
MMYFNPAKERPVGCRLDGGKLARKTHKSWAQLKRHDPDVVISEEPTEHLFVSNSSVLCGVTLEELEEVFLPFDSNAIFTVFPNKSINAAFKPTSPMPAIVEQLIDRLTGEKVIAFRPDQVTVNIYEAGQGIPPHFDTHSAFEDPIVSLSMCSDVVMEFKDAANSALICPVLLKRRSLCLIGGESRYRWKHGIVNRKYDINPLTNRLMRRELRVSLTLRKIRHEPCQCPFKEFCDWDRGGEMAVPSDESAAQRIEKLYVNGVYDNIASHFDETRFSSWSGVKRFLDSLPDYSLVYDIGCGNGKYLLLKNSLCKIGCDMSRMLCEIADGKGCMVVHADGLAIPFREVADAVLSIAVLHHMALLSRRQQLIKEILRVSIVTVYNIVNIRDITNLGVKKYAKMRENKDISTDAAQLDRLLIHDGKDFVQQDMLVPWRIDEKGETFLRYYHVFAEGEMEELLRSVGGCTIDSIEKEQGNYIATITKTCNIS